MKKVYIEPKMSQMYYEIEDVLTLSAGGVGGNSPGGEGAPVEVTLTNSQVVWFDKAAE